MLKTENKNKKTTSFEVPPQKRLSSGTYGISQAFAELDEFMHEVEGDISSEENALRYEELSNACYINQEEALYQTALFDKELKSRVAARKAEVVRLEKLNSIDNAMLDENKQMIRRLLDYVGVVKAQARHLVVSIKRNGGKQPLEIIPHLLPEQYVRHTPTPLRDEIEAALKEDPGLYIPGVRVLDRGTHVEIK